MSRIDDLYKQQVQDPDMLKRQLGIGAGITNPFGSWIQQQNEQERREKITLLQMAMGLTQALVTSDKLRTDSEVAEAINTIFKALSRELNGPAPTSVAPEPAVPMYLSPKDVKASIRKDGLVSFIDGKSYKTLKRHLTKHGLTPDSYRRNYGLPEDYPMVTRAYSERRSQLARANQLGVKAKAA